MATFTENYGLRKPGQEDFYNIADFNGNMDAIDGALARNDAETARLGALLEKGSGGIKSLQSCRIAIGSHNGSAAKTLRKTEKEKSLVLLQRLLDQSAMFTKVDYQFDGETLTVSTANDSSSKCSLLLEFWVVEFC